MRDLQIEEFTGAVRDFGTYLAAHNYRNRKSYVYSIVEMLEWMEQSGIGSLIEIKKRDLHRYFNYLMGRPSRLGGNIGESHLKNNGYAVELFFRMLLENGVIERGIRVPRKILKGEKQERQVVTKDELKMMYEATVSSLERVIISLAYGCGFRRSEIAALNLGDIRFTRKEIHIVRGKGDKFRTQLMDDFVMKDLKEYISKERHQLLRRKQTREIGLLINRVGKRMSGDSINKRLKDVIERTGNVDLINKKITLHCLRHSIAMHFIEKGVSMEFIQRFLGHSEIDTSQIYAQKRAIANKYR